MFLYRWVPYIAVEMSKLLPIFFCALKLAIWLSTLVSLSKYSWFSYFIFGLKIRIMHFTMHTITHAELPNPVFVYPALQMGNYEESVASEFEIKSLQKISSKQILPIEVCRRQFNVTSSAASTKLFCLQFFYVILFQLQLYSHFWLI